VVVISDPSQSGLPPPVSYTTQNIAYPNYANLFIFLLFNQQQIEKLQQVNKREVISHLLQAF